MVRNSTIFSVRTKRGTYTRVRERETSERECQRVGETRGKDPHEQQGRERAREREGQERGRERGKSEDNYYLHERQGAAAVVQLGVVGGGQHHAQHLVERERETGRRDG